LVECVQPGGASRVWQEGKIGIEPIRLKGHQPAWDEQEADYETHPPCHNKLITWRAFGFKAAREARWKAAAPVHKGKKTFHDTPDEGVIHHWKLRTAENGPVPEEDSKVRVALEISLEM